MKNHAVINLEKCVNAHGTFKKIFNITATEFSNRSWSFLLSIFHSFFQSKSSMLNNFNQNNFNFEKFVLNIHIEWCMEFDIEQKCFYWTKYLARQLTSIVIDWKTANRTWQLCSDLERLTYWTGLDILWKNVSPSKPFCWISLKNK